MLRIIASLKARFARSTAAADVATDPLDYSNIIHLDAEDLAEQGILSAYQSLLPQLRGYAASELEVQEHFDEHNPSYAVTAGALRYEIWGPGLEEAHDWGRATFAFFHIVNRTLADCPYKFYALYGGNDLFGIFLTASEQEAAIKGIAQPNQRPYLPVDIPPSFGLDARDAS